MKGKNISLDVEALEILEQNRYTLTNGIQSYSKAVKNLEKLKQEYKEMFIAIKRRKNKKVRKC